MSVEKITCYCSSCKHDTWHYILKNARTTSEDDNYWWYIDYYIVKCCGCDTICFLTESQEESDIDFDENGNTFFKKTYKTYPFHKHIVERLKDLWFLPSNIKKIYEEILESLNNHCYLLAAAGFRVIIEAICEDRKIEGKSLETKINNLCKKGIITHNDRDRLHSIRFMGNDSVHSVIEPTKEQLLLVLAIIHNMLNNLYILTAKCMDILEGPITTFEDFETLLDVGLKKYQVGHIDILRNLLPPTIRLITEDRENFETELQNKIKSGEYRKLAICPKSDSAKNIQYKILDIDNSILTEGKSKK